MLKKFFDLIQLYDTNLTKVRMGHQFDGGYIVLDELVRETDTVYSFGIADDATFESSIYETYKTPIIRMYDPYVQGIPYDGWRGASKTLEAIFEKRGVGSKKTNTFDTLENFILQNNDINKNLLLKMDIEGGEWESIDVTPKHILTKFNQIVLELHDLNRISYECKKCIQSINPCTPLSEPEVKIRYNVLKKLTDDFFIFHAHANNGFPIQKLENIYVPPILELSFVRKNLVNPLKVNWTYHKLDNTNNHNLPEIQLNFWPFIR